MADCPAPWTDEQVGAIMRYQRDPSVHPFTCPNQGVVGLGGEHPRDPLLAATAGLFCLHCTYRQDWVHDFMATWPA